MVIPVVIEDYQKIWQQEFESIKAILMNTLKGYVIDIEHVGSTSVPKCPSQAILDIDVIIGNYKYFDIIKSSLAKIGYRHLPQESKPGMEIFEPIDLFEKYEKNMRLWMKQHLYVCHALSPDLQSHLAFRDYLRNNDKERLNYGKLKKNLASKYHFERGKYDELKSDHIKKILVKAGFIEKKFIKPRRLMSTEDKIIIFKRVAERFNKERIHWALGGSALLYFHEMVNRFEDIDLMVSVTDYQRARHILDQFGNPKFITQSFRFKTKNFAKYVISGVVFDLMAGLKIKKLKVWHQIDFDDDLVDKKIKVGNTMIALAKLEAWLHYYDLMERYSKVKLIEDYLAGKRY